MWRRTSNRGVTLIEAVVAISVLAIAIPPLVGLFTEVASHGTGNTYQGVAVVYADSLMEEIVSKAYEDPDEPSGSFGSEEAFRSSYDDIDDYDGMSNSPPERIDGTTLGDYGGFTRSATVDNVTAADPDPTTPQSDGSTDFKRIEVTVVWTGGSGGEVTLSTLRTHLVGFDGPLDEQGSAATAVNNDPKSLELALINATSSDLEIASFSLSANRSVPDVKKFELATIPDSWTQIWGGQEPLPTGTLNTDQSNPSERVVPGAGWAGAYFEFDGDISPGPITFTLVLNFTDGSSSTLEIPIIW